MLDFIRIFVGKFGETKHIPDGKKYTQKEQN